MEIEFTHERAYGFQQQQTGIIYFLLNCLFKITKRKKNGLDNFL